MRCRFALTLVLAAQLISTAAWAEVGDQRTAATVLTTGEFDPSDLGAHAVAMGPFGDAVVVWKGGPQDAVFSLRRFDAHGSPIGGLASFGVSVTGGPIAGDLHVAVGGDNAAFLVWEASSAEDDGDIRMLRIAANGQVIGSVRTVNTDREGAQSLPSLTTDDLGHLLVTWTGPVGEGGYGVFAQLFDSAGIQQFEQFRMDERAAPLPVKSAGGIKKCCQGYVVAWLDVEATISTTVDLSGNTQTSISYAGQTLLARNFRLDGQPTGDIVSLSGKSVISEDPVPFAVGVDVEGDIVVVWTDLDGTRLQRTDGVLGLSGDPVLLDFPSSAPSETSLQVLMGAQGRGVVTWADSGFANPHAAFQPIDSNGPTGPATEWRVEGENEFVAIADVAGDLDGDLGVSWFSRVNPWDSELELNIARFEGGVQLDAGLVGTMQHQVPVGGFYQMWFEFRNYSAGSGSPGALGSLTNARLELTLDPRLTLVFGPDDWECGATSGVPIICTAPQPLPGNLDRLSGRFFFSAPAEAAELHNRLSVSALQGDPDLSNNEFEFVVSVVNN